MAHSRIPAHDMATAGPTTETSSPKPGQVQRSSTILSQSSGRTSFSLTFRAKAHHPCPNPECNASSLGLQSFRFSGRQSIRNPLQCSTCHYFLMYIGGSPPVSRSATFNVVGAEANTSRKRPSIPGLNNRPSIGSTLAIGGLTASSVAFPSPSSLGSDGVQAHDFQATTDITSDNYRGKESESSPAKKIATNQRRKQKPSILRDLVLRRWTRANMRRFVIKKLNVTAEDLDVDQVTPPLRAVPTTRSNASVLAPSHNHIYETPEEHRDSMESMQVKHPDSISELDTQVEHARISAHMSSHNEPRRSQERLSISSLTRRNFIGGAWSQGSKSDSTLNPFGRPTRNRDSASSYASNLSFGERSDIQPPIRPQAPQAPHPSAAAGPSTVPQVLNFVGQLERNQRDSVMEE